MDYDRVPVCRLCLEIVYDGKFQEAENIIIILQNMLPQLNFTVSSQPVICNKCMEIIQKSYSFKSVCLETEKYLQNYRPSGSSTIYLEEAVYNKMLENEIKAEKTNKGKICRFCLQILEGDLSTQLGVVEYMLGKCLAELDLTISANPVICGPCLENLQNQFYFIMSCLDIEARINNYCSTRDTNSNDPVNLHDMLVYTLQTPGDKINHNTSFNGLRDVNVKLEDSDSKNAKSLKEYERDFIEDGVNSDSTLDANLEVNVLGVVSSYDELGIRKLPHELDHDYSNIIQPSPNKGLLTIRIRKEKLHNLAKTKLQPEKNLKYYKQKYRRASKKLHNLRCLLQQLRDRNLISKEVYEEIWACK